MSRPILLALRALGLGDLLTAVPALRALDRHFDGHRKVLAAPRALAPLLELAGTGFEIADVRFVAQLQRWHRDAGARNPDVAVNLHGCGPQSHRALLSTSPRRLIAFSHPAVAASRAGPCWNRDEHETVRWCRMLRELGVPADHRDIELRPPPVCPVNAMRGASVV